MSVAARTVVLASRNRDKLRELSEICAELPFKVVSSLDFPGLPEIIEDGTTTLGNALRKAIVTAAYTGEIAVADDTSLRIGVLGGLPDVFASRFAGPEANDAKNVELVLELLRDVPEDARQARFETGMAWIDPRPPSRPVLQDLAPAQASWFRNPFAGACAPASGEDVDGHRDAPGDRRRVWADYRASLMPLADRWGVDLRRVVGILDSLIVPCMTGGQPAAEPPGAVRLPDPRLWLIDDPRDRIPAPTPAEPAGLPQDAPGRAVNGPVWLGLSAAGRLPGGIGHQPLGSGGFGYDPIFLPAGHERTLAEMAPEQKNAISHRARAMRRLAAAAVRAYRLAEARA